MNSKIWINLLWSSYWIEQEDVKMPTPTCHFLEHKTQCLYYMLWLNRGVDQSLPALQEAPSDSSSIGDDTSQLNPLTLVFHINLCSFQSERQKMNLCWSKRPESSLWTSKWCQQTEKHKLCGLLYITHIFIICYINYIMLCYDIIYILFYDFTCVHIQIPI